MRQLHDISSFSSRVSTSPRDICSRRAGPRRPTAAILLMPLALGIWTWFGTTGGAALSSADRSSDGDPAACSVPQLAIAPGRAEAERTLQEPVLPDKLTDLEWRDLPLTTNDPIAEIVAIPQYT